VVTYVGECYKVLRSSLDGKNLEVVLLEFGIRLHRVIYDHIQQFSINEMGMWVCVYVCGLWVWAGVFVLCVCVVWVCWEGGCSFACRAC